LNISSINSYSFLGGFYTKREILNYIETNTMIKSRTIFWKILRIFY